MKKITALLLAICLLGCSTTALAATTGYVTDNRIATRSGPATKYTEPGSFLSYGARVKVHTKVWDSANTMYWVQVEFTSGRETYRAYTGDWRLDVDLSRVPDEVVVDNTWLNYSTRGYAGPGTEYHYYGDILLYKDSNCRIIEVENNFALIDTSGSNKGWTRVWVPLDAVFGGYAYYGQDTHPDYWYNDDQGATLLPDDDQGAILLPGGSSNSWYQEPVGQYCTVWVDSGNARTGAGTQYAHAAYVVKGDVLLILDRKMGGTGKDWYQVRIDGKLCWLSSGLVTFNGNSNGTANGIPIVLEDPYADYRQSSTWKIGQWFRVNSDSAHVREMPNTTSRTVGYVTRNQYYEILDCRIGSTGKEWFLIEVEGEKGWISSGLVTLLN